MKKNIIPDINLQNEIQKNKILNSRDFYKGKSFRFLHEWHDGTTYFNDDFYTDFVVYQNVLLACSNTHTSNSSNVPVIIYKGLQPIGVENSEFWLFVFSGIVNPDASFKVQFSSSVESLPNASEHIGEIFVVGPVGNSGNAYEEYIAIHTPSYNEEYTWELIGGGNTSIDLSNYYTKEEINDRYQPRGHYLTRIPEEYITDTELDERESAIIEHVDELISKQNDNISSKQDTLISGQNIKTINGASVLGEGNIELAGNVDLSNYYTKDEIADKGYVTEESLTGYATVGQMNSLKDHLDDLISDTNTDREIINTALQPYVVDFYVSDIYDLYYHGPKQLRIDIDALCDALNSGRVIRIKMDEYSNGYLIAGAYVEDLLYMDFWRGLTHITIEVDYNQDSINSESITIIEQGKLDGGEVSFENYE